VLTNSMR